MINSLPISPCNSFNLIHASRLLICFWSYKLSISVLLSPNNDFSLNARPKIPSAKKLHKFYEIALPMFAKWDHLPNPLRPTDTGCSITRPTDWSLIVKSPIFGMENQKESVNQRKFNQTRTGEFQLPKRFPWLFHQPLPLYHMPLQNLQRLICMLMMHRNRIDAFYLSKNQKFNLRNVK